MHPEKGCPEYSKKGHLSLAMFALAVIVGVMAMRAMDGMAIAVGGMAMDGMAIIKSRIATSGIAAHCLSSLAMGGGVGGEHSLCSEV